VSYNLSLATNVVQARYRPTDEITRPEDLPPPLLALNAAQRRLDAGWEALRSQDPLLAMRLGAVASNATQGILAEAQHTIAEELASPQSSPLAVTPAGFGLHWQLADACERSDWVGIEMPGQNFSNLEALMQSGWSQQRRLEDKVALRVELIPHSTSHATSSADSGGLRLAAYPKPEFQGRLEGGYAGASLRVRSAGLPVRAGQLVRISATARVIQSSQQPGCGLLIYDNQVGPSLGQLVDGRPGDSLPVELYRLIVDDGPFRILAECRGQVDVVLESVQASVITPATNRRKYTTAPLDSLPGPAVLTPVRP
jgi:hypothetical protein